jgi:excisionase family DNA binding protein
MESQTKKLALDVRSAADMISLSKRTLENYIQAKVIPSIKAGRRRLVLVRDLEKFLQADRPSVSGVKGGTREVLSGR